MNKDYKPKIGDILWVSHIDRRDKNLDCQGTVTKVGKKYFYVKTGLRDEERYRLEDFTHENGEYSSRYRLFETKEVFIKYEETIRRRKELCNHLLQFLSDGEVDELYDLLLSRDTH